MQRRGDSATRETWGSDLPGWKGGERLGGRKRDRRSEAGVKWTTWSRSQVTIFFWSKKEGDNINPSIYKKTDVLLHPSIYQKRNVLLYPSIIISKNESIA